MAEKGQAPVKPIMTEAGITAKTGKGWDYWFKALDSLPKGVLKEGSRPVRIKTAITAAAANPRTRGSMLRSAVNGNDAATTGAAA